MPKRIPPAVLAYLRQMGKAYGSQGGKTAAKNMTAAERKARAKKASLVAAKNRARGRYQGGGESRKEKVSRASTELL